VRLNEIKINGMVNTFGERPIGEIIAPIGNTRNLGIAVVNGNSAAKLGVKPGDEILVTT
jgi:S-adenosylmethionine hydrolase